MTEDLEQRFTKNALATRSDAYQWLWANRAEIAAVLSKHSRRPWLALAQTAADYGKSFTSASLRMAWQRLERDLARAGVTEGEKSKPNDSVAQLPTTVRAQPPAMDDDNPYGFKLGAEPKRWTKPN